MPTLLEGKIALVTGGASGIGRATASIFAREGAKVVVADVLEDGGAETARMIEDAGGEASFVRCDVTDPASVEALVKRVVDIYGRLDCAFNNAGIEGVPYAPRRRQRGRELRPRHRRQPEGRLPVHEVRDYR